MKSISEELATFAPSWRYASKDRSLEAYLQEGAKVASSSEIDFIWKSLGSNDRDHLTPEISK